MRLIGLLGQVRGIPALQESSQPWADSVETHPLIDRSYLPELEGCRYTSKRKLHENAETILPLAFRACCRRAEAETKLVKHRLRASAILRS